MKLKRYKRVLIYFLFLFPAVLYAHKLHHPKVIIVEVNKNNIRVMLNYIVNPGDESTMLRKKFDTDRNGKLNQEEQEQLQKYLIKNVLSSFALYLNRERPDFEPLDYRTENIDAEVNSSSAISIDIHLVSKNMNFLKENELVISDFLMDNKNHIPTIVKFSADFQILQTSQGKIIKKSNLIRDIELERGIDVKIKFKRL